MDLPDLTKLSLGEGGTRAKWLKACGVRPRFRNWRNLRGSQKRTLLHDVARLADDDTTADGDYVSAYEQVDIDDMFAGNSQWSVEHVVPRSHIDGRRAHAAENDPIGWIEATASANSRRSNYPLYLWPDVESEGVAGAGVSIALPNTLVRVDGEIHYVPPMEQRARLARKWLFIRATYPGIDPPSAAQKARGSQIVALAKHYPVQPAELRVNKHYRDTMGWANPLLEKGGERWLEDASWRALILFSF